MARNQRRFLWIWLGLTVALFLTVSYRLGRPSPAPGGHLLPTPRSPLQPTLRFPPRFVARPSIPGRLHEGLGKVSERGGRTFGFGFSKRSAALGMTTSVPRS